MAALGATVQFAAEVHDQYGQVITGVAVAWASSDATVAGVDASGLVTAAANGTAAVTATASGASGSTAVTVAQVVNTVTVSPSADMLAALGDTVRLSAEARDANGHVVGGAEFTWTSADTAVAVVDESGLVTAANNGAATITATAGEASGMAAVGVMQVPGSVVVSPPEPVVALGATLRLVAEAFDENGHGVKRAEFTWASSDAAVARVDQSALVTGVGEGSATITAMAGETSGSAEVTVENPARDALVALYEATDGPNWNNNENWLTDAPLGDWYGVQTNQHGRVSGLELKDNGLFGVIPPSTRPGSRGRTT